MNAIKVNPIPDGFHTVTPYFVVKGAAEFIDFLIAAFDAKGTEVMKGPDGALRHAQLKIGNSYIMLADSNEKFPPRPVTTYLYVDDCDAYYHKAIGAGGTSLREPTNEFYGDRSAGIMDVFGNQWWIGTHIEDVSEEEMARRQKAMEGVS